MSLLYYVEMNEELVTKLTLKATLSLYEMNLINDLLKLNIFFVQVLICCKYYSYL